MTCQCLTHKKSAKSEFVTTSLVFFLVFISQDPVRRHNLYDSLDKKSLIWRIIQSNRELTTKG